MTRLARLWQLLNAPSRFEDDPYGGLLNQWGHYALGVAAFSLSCAVYFAALGEMPSRLWAAVAVGGGYLWIELFVQKWQGKDTVEDLVFVYLGIASIATTLREVDTLGWQSVIVIEVGNLIACILAALVACLMYGMARINDNR